MQTEVGGSSRKSFSNNEIKLFIFLKGVAFSLLNHRQSCLATDTFHFFESFIFNRGNDLPLEMAETVCVLVRAFATVVLCQGNILPTHRGAT